MNVVYNDRKSSLIAYQMHRMKKQRFVFVIKLLLSLVVPILIICAVVISIQSKGVRLWVLLAAAVVSFLWVLFVSKTFLKVSIKLISAFIPEYESQVEITINEKRIHYKDCIQDIHSEAVVHFQRENKFLAIIINSETEVLIPLDKLNKEEQDSFLFYLSRLKRF